MFTLINRVFRLINRVFTLLKRVFDSSGFDYFFVVWRDNVGNLSLYLWDENDRFIPFLDSILLNLVNGAFPFRGNV